MNNTFGSNILSKIKMDNKTQQKSLLQMDKFYKMEGLNKGKLQLDILTFTTIIWLVKLGFLTSYLIVKICLPKVILA